MERLVFSDLLILLGDRDVGSCDGLDIYFGCDSIQKFGGQSSHLKSPEEGMNKL
jgi:hypothetical protein